jgi:GxxExxY protein
MPTKPLLHGASVDRHGVQGVHEDQGEAAAAFGDLTGAIIDAGLKVHRAPGPGLLESVYEHCLAHELRQRGLSFKRQLTLPVVYEGLKPDAGYRADLLVDEKVIVELKASEGPTRLHEAQLLAYLRLSRYPVGLLMNFNVILFKDGLRRYVV